MCGIAGYISQSIQPSDGLPLLKAMTNAIAHRGPDGEGFWISENNKVGLAHRRLSIIDLSESAGQPMHYLDRYTIIFNGEIYNYIEIKKKLVDKGYIFNTESDTEVLLALFHEMKEDCLKELDGMFAFVIYDKNENKVFFARDRFGEKPLYYCAYNGNFYFASEMKALWAAGVPKCVNDQMLYNYFANDLLENPFKKSETFYSGIDRLAPSHYLYFSTNTMNHEPKRYWDIETGEQQSDLNFKKASEELNELFFTSVSRRLRSDVPLGSSLSGGLDSSLIVCAVDKIDEQKKINRKTFSAQFPGFEKDESYYQKLVIDKCHVDPHFVNPTEESLVKSLDKVAYHQEEPFGSASINIQYEVFELAKKNNVTVLLDGQGADEIFAGYHYYYPAFFSQLKKNNRQLYKEQWNDYKKLHSENNINQVLNKDWKYYVKRMIPDFLQNPLQKIRTLDKTALLDNKFKEEHGGSYKTVKQFSDLRSFLYFNTMQSGLEILLRYADRNSMAHSREVRLPFLYHKLVEFLFSLPDTFKINHGWTKWIMRETFKDLLPEKIAWRKDKIGYEPPQKKWSENKIIMEQIRESKKLLINKGIISSRPDGNILNHTNDWKFLVISKTLYS